MNLGRKDMEKFCNINNSKEEGFIDFSFDIVKYKRKLMGNLYIECVASDNDINIGFGLEIKNKMRGIIDGNINSFCTYLDGLKIIFKDGISDYLIKSMLKFYGFEDMDLNLRKETYIECGSLSAEPLDYNNSEIKFKCFFDSSNINNMYAEMYINIDLKNKKIYLNEKSSEYRENIIKNLSI